MSISVSSVEPVDVLVDFDNVFARQTPDAAQMRSLLSRLVGIATDLWPDTSRTIVRLYGGWLRDGTLAPHGSAVQAAVAADRFFPVRHPDGSSILRGEVELTTRLVALPELEWGHTFGERVGLPYVRFRDGGGYPLACTLRSGDCPLKQIRRFSSGHSQKCFTAGCDVQNREAFRTPEQKMVDVMLACDVIASAANGSRILVVTSDLDVLPALAMAAKNAGPGRTALWRGDRSATDLYKADLETLGVRFGLLEDHA